MLGSPKSRDKVSLVFAMPARSASGPTPTPTPTEAHISRFERAHRILDGETDLSPRNPVINQTLSALVEAICSSKASPSEVRAVLESPRIRCIRPSLLAHLGTAESELEAHYAASFIDSDERPDLTLFPYHRNYIDLVDQEVDLLAQCIDISLAERIVVVGSGPLPFTALLFAERLGLPAVAVDCDARAAQRSRSLIARLGTTDVTVVHRDACRFAYRTTDIVHVAAMITPKDKVLRRIAAACPIATIVRTAEQLVELLYEPVREEQLLAAGYEVLGVTKFVPEVLNTAYIVRPRAAAAEQRRGA